jgi:predicted metal-dependent enzyme (double-stranded beta helix superfamily)
MGLTLADFAARCHAILAREDNPAGRQKVAALLREALRDQAFVAAQFANDAPERRILYEDPDLAFCILAHEYRGAKESRPHDHGPSWAIYGQAEGESVMNEYERVDGAAGKVRKMRSHTMRPGDARVYNEGDVHAVTHTGPSRLVRVEGQDLAKVRRGTYEVVC